MLKKQQDEEDRQEQLATQTGLGVDEIKKRDSLDSIYDTDEYYNSNNNNNNNILQQQPQQQIFDNNYRRRSKDDMTGGMGNTTTFNLSKPEFKKSESSVGLEVYDHLKKTLNQDYKQQSTDIFQPLTLENLNSIEAAKEQNLIKSNSIDSAKTDSTISQLSPERQDRVMWRQFTEKMNTPKYKNASKEKRQGKLEKFKKSIYQKKKTTNFWGYEVDSNENLLTDKEIKWLTNKVNSFNV